MAFLKSIWRLAAGRSAARGALDYLDDIPASPVTRQQAATLFERFKDEPRLAWHVGLDCCECRADLMCDIAAEEFGIETLKCWAYSEMAREVIPDFSRDTFSLFLNRSQTEPVPWTYHVAPGCLVKDGGDREVLTVLDPLLFDEPVPRHRWLDLLGSQGAGVSTDVTGRYVFEVHGPRPSTVGMRRLMTSERDARLASCLDFDIPSTARAYETHRRGHWADDLSETDPALFGAFRQALSDCDRNVVFRLWWHGASMTGSEVARHLEAHGVYMNIPAEDIVRLIRPAPPEDHHFLIKTSFWQRILPFTQHLHDRFRALAGRDRRRIRAGAGLFDEFAALVRHHDDDEMSPDRLIAVWSRPQSVELWERFRAWPFRPAP